MNLSPFAQYCIRKLIRQNIDELNPSFSAEVQEQILAVKLEYVLHHLYPKKLEFCEKIDELEILTKVYLDLEKSKINLSNQLSIKHRIFKLLGLDSSNFVPPLPTIVQEASVSKFCFYHQEKIEKGIYICDELYGAVHQFSPLDRLRAYQVAWAIAAQNVPLVMTVSERQYILWVSLRSAAYSTLVVQKPNFFKAILLVYSMLRKCHYQIFRRSKPL